MGAEYYKGKAIPVFESMVAHGDNVFGLALSRSGESYYLFEVCQTPMKCRMRLKVAKGTTLELEVNTENEVGVHCTAPDGNDKGFVALPL